MGTVTLGLDVGQKVDSTALAVVETERRQVKGRDEVHHLVRHLVALPLGTPYPQVVEHVARVVRGVREQPGVTRVRLYVDATGVGTPIVDALKEAGVRPVGCYFTHGDRRVAKEDGSISLGKAWLVSRLVMLLQTACLHLPGGSVAAALRTELLDYEIRIDEQANDKYGAFRVGSHDDLVTAVGLATQDDGPVRFQSW